LVSTLDAKATFVRHLVILKAKFCHPKSKGPNCTLVVSLLDGALFDQQVFFDIIIVKSNNHGALHLPLDYNPM
jgi:hypothetical protein